jgi:hypothetical protein
LISDPMASQTIADGNGSKSTARHRSGVAAIRQVG